MEEKELVMRLANEAENARDREEHDLADLLDEAEGELELALGLIEKMDTPAARTFVARHSVPDEQAQPNSHAELMKWATNRLERADWRRRLQMLLDAEKFVSGRDVVPVDEALIAMSWNEPHPDMAEPDRVMYAGGFERVGSEYRRRHNVGVNRRA
jgi:hypothetical protein